MRALEGVCGGFMIKREVGVLRMSVEKTVVAVRGR
jgi:hypothetical protein